MGTYETRYETKDGKTRRVKNTSPAPSGAPGKASAPKPNPGADNTNLPAEPVKKGV
jgi:hypothetical protein